MKYHPSSHPHRRQIIIQKENRHRPDLKPLSMSLSGADTATINAVSHWLDDQLHSDALIYTTYILSSFHAKSKNYSYFESDEFIVNGQKNRKSVTDITENLLNTDGGYRLMEKKNCGIESLIDKLWKELNSIDQTVVNNNGSFPDNYYGDRTVARQYTTFSVAGNDGPPSSSSPSSNWTKDIFNNRKLQNSVSDEKFIMSDSGKSYEQMGLEKFEEEYQEFAVELACPPIVKVKNPSPGKTKKTHMYLWDTSSTCHKKSLIERESLLERTALRCQLMWSSPSRPIVSSTWSSLPSYSSSYPSQPMSSSFSGTGSSILISSSPDTSGKSPTNKPSRSPQNIPSKSESRSTSSGSYVEEEIQPEPEPVSELFTNHLYADHRRIHQWLMYMHSPSTYSHDDWEVFHHIMLFYTYLQTEEELQLYDDLDSYGSTSWPEWLLNLLRSGEDPVNEEEDLTGEEEEEEEVEEVGAEEEEESHHVAIEMAEQLLDEDSLEEKMLLGEVAEPGVPEGAMLAKPAKKIDAPIQPYPVSFIPLDPPPKEHEEEYALHMLATEMAEAVLKDDHDSEEELPRPEDIVATPPITEKKELLVQAAPRPETLLFGNEINFGAFLEPSYKQEPYYWSVFGAAVSSLQMPADEDAPFEPYVLFPKTKKPYELAVEEVLSMNRKEQWGSQVLSYTEMEFTETEQWISTRAVDLHLEQINQSLQQINHNRCGPFKAVTKLPQLNEALLMDQFLSGENQDRGLWSDSTVKQLPSTREIKILNRSGDSTSIDVPVDACTHFTPIKQEYLDGTTFPIASDLARITYQRSPDGSLYLDNQRYRVYSPPPELFSQLGFQQTAPPRSSAKTTQIKTKVPSSNSSKSPSSSHQKSPGAETLHSASAETNNAHPCSSSSFSSTASSHSSSQNSSSVSSNSPSEISFSSSSTTKSPFDDSKNNIIETEPPDILQQKGCFSVNEEFRLKFAVRQTDVGCQTVSVPTPGERSEVKSAVGTHDDGNFNELLRPQGIGIEETVHGGTIPERSSATRRSICGDFSEYDEFLQSMTFRKHDTIPSNLQSFLQNELFFSRQFSFENGNTGGDAAAGERSKFFPLPNNNNNSNSNNVNSNNTNNIGRISKTIWLIQASDPAPIMNVYDLGSLTNSVVGGGENGNLAFTAPDNDINGSVPRKNNGNAAFEAPDHYINGGASQNKSIGDGGPYCKICNKYVLNWDAYYKLQVNSTRNAIWFDHEGYKMGVCRQCQFQNCQFQNSTVPKSSTPDLDNHLLSMVDDVNRFFENCGWGEDNATLMC